MSHLIHNKAKLFARIRRLKGQMEAIERALEAEAPCREVLNQVASVRGAVSGLTVELIESHLHEHVADVADATAREAGAADLLQAIRTYLR